MLRRLNMYDAYNPMPLDDVLARYPTLTATTPHASRSARYAQIGTEATLRALDASGFRIHGLQLARVRDPSRNGFEKHVIRMRHVDAKPLSDGSVPEAIMSNAHDGTSAYALFCGVFRFFCFNGLVVGADWGSIKVYHSGKNTADKVASAATSIVGSFGRLSDSVETFQGIQLSPVSQLEFANRALQLRYPIDESGMIAAPIAPAQLVETVRRDADRGNDLWTVFNRVQENLTAGGLAGTSQGRTRRRLTTRPLSGIDSSLRVNRGLFDLAEEFAYGRPANVASRAAFGPTIDGELADVA